MIAPLSPTENFRVVVEFCRTTLRYRALLGEMTRRDLFDPYAGQVFGALWAFLHPLAMMAVYVFVFAFVFKVRIGDDAAMPFDYTVYLLSGLIPWLGIVASLSKGTSTLLQHRNLVKQAVFPIEILPMKTTLAAMVPQIIGLLILLVYVLVVHDRLPLTYLLIPIVLLLQIAFLLGITFVLSALTCFVRDIKDVIQVLVIAGVYLLPVLYLPAWVPEAFEPLLYVNPFSYPIWIYQDVLYFGRIEHPFAWWTFPAMACLSLAGGYRLFRRMRPHLGGVL